MESCLTEAGKKAEWEAALAMMSAIAGSKEITLAADKGYQDQKCIEGLQALGVVPLVAEYKPSKNWKKLAERQGT